MEKLDQALLRQLVGRRSLSDVDFVTDLGIDYADFNASISRLVDDGLVKIVSPHASTETVYQLIDSSETRDRMATVGGRSREAIS